MTLGDYVLLMKSKLDLDEWERIFGDLSCKVMDICTNIHNYVLMTILWLLIKVLFLIL